MALVPTDRRADVATYLYEKHIDHQEGIAGTLSIRLVEARNLRAAASMFWVRTCDPYVIFRFGKQSVRSTTVRSNDNPSWRRELLEMKIPKLDFKRSPLEDHSNVLLELTIDAMNEDSITGKATEAVGMTSGSVIGTAVVDFTALLEGKEEVMDRWIPLSGGLPMASLGGKDLVLGEVRIVLQYEPHGMEPMVGDVVKMEGFGYYPSAILAPVDEMELHVKKISGSFLLCRYVTKSGFDAQLRVHRNQVFVAHRGSVLDRLYVRCIAEPLEFVSNTPLGLSIRDFARPYVKVARAFSFPALMAAKTTIMTTVRASSAAIGAVVDAME